MTATDSNEALSAFVDGEIEGPGRDRVVGALYEDPKLRRMWARFHLIGDAMRRTGPVPGAGAIAGNVTAALAGEPVVRLKPRPRRAIRRPLAGLALAATVAGIAVLGIHRLDTGAGESRPAAVADASRPASVTASAVSHAPERSGAQVASPAAGGMRIEASRLQWIGVAPDAEARLNVYLVNHSEYAGNGVRGMHPYVRIVGYRSFTGEGER